jgi:penicillin-binding protein 1A
MEPIFIQRLEYKNGKILEEFEQSQESRRVLSEDKAYLMIDLLKGTIDERGGTGGRLRFKYKLKGELAGKTGTTQNQSDGWFVNAIPHLVTGVWTGCGDRQMRFRSITYGQGAAMSLPTVGLFLQKVYADQTIGITENDHFERPAGVDVPSCLNVDDMDEGSGETPAPSKGNGFDLDDEAALPTKRTSLTRGGSSRSELDY